MGHSATSGQVLRGLEREVACLELRKSGLSYRAIAAQLNISKSGAHNAIVRALGRLNAKNAEETRDLRMLEAERLDDLLGNLWPNRQRPIYVDRILRIMERRARLFGLDAPTRAEISADATATLTIEYINDWRTRSLE